MIDGFSKSERCKTLSELTDEPMMRCKTALELSNWDIKEAKALLQIRGSLERATQDQHIRRIVREELMRLGFRQEET